MSKQVMQQALDALENLSRGRGFDGWQDMDGDDVGGDLNDAVTALREAIAAPDEALKAAQPVEPAVPQNIINAISEYGDARAGQGDLGAAIGNVICAIRSFAAAIAQPAPAVPYQVTDEDVDAAFKATLIKHAYLTEESMRTALQAYEARKAAA